jgi:hypothetical protein
MTPRSEDQGNNEQVWITFAPFGGQKLTGRSDNIYRSALSVGSRVVTRQISRAEALG